MLTPEELSRLYADAVGVGVEAQRRYLTLLKTEPPPDLVAEIDSWDAPGEGARVLGRAVYWWIDHPNAEAKLSNASFVPSGEKSIPFSSPGGSVGAA